MILLPLLLATAPPTSRKMSSSHHRTFQFVPYGQSAPKNHESGDSKTITTISCDGRITGTTLELTHWTDNVTPDDLYADTSTEIALNFARKLLGGGYDGDGGDMDIDNAIILNNHYDTDGVLSVWTCLNPQEALDNAELLIAGAEAGDFGEWPTDLGVKLDCALCQVEAECSSEAEGYKVALDMLPQLLDDLKNNNGERNKDLWKYGWEDAVAGWDAIVDGRVKIEVAGSVALVTERENAPALSPYALHRGLKEAGLAGDQSNAVDRVLHIRMDGQGKYRYNYRKPGYGWVSRLVRRKSVASVDSDRLIAGLNSKIMDGAAKGCWTSGGGLTGICRTNAPVDIEPQHLLEKLEVLDEKGVKL